MRREPRWLTLEAVLALHDEQIARFGGSPGLLMPTALEAAVARPVNSFHYDEQADIPALAALYLVGLANAHAFVDGNKRVALAAMLVFLVLNGQPLHVGPEKLYALVLDVATGRLKEDGVAQWLRASAA